MPDLQFSCPHCSQALEAPDEMSGDAVECPGCSRKITVPGIGKPEQASAPAAPSPATGVEKCPSCGSELASEAVLCVSCGYHTGLGKKITTSLS